MSLPVAARKQKYIFVTKCEHKSPAIDSLNCRSAQWSAVLFMLTAQELLLTRSSMPKLIEPGPDATAIRLLEQAALRVPDHLQLTPYRCLLFQGAERAWLGDLYARAAHEEQLSARDQQRAAELPLRAPLIITCVTHYQNAPKVPLHEQYASAACATMAMQQMAFSLGYGAIWRTGPYAESATVAQGLGLAANDQIVAFLYVGTPAVPTPIKPAKQKRIFQSGVDRKK